MHDLPIFVINLDHRRDRWQAAQKELKRVGLFKNVERFSAIKPTKEISNRPDYLPAKKLAYRIGCLGCLLSHQSVIKEAKKRGFPAVLILEDDIGFKKPLSILQSALDQLNGTDFDILYLSGTHMDPCNKVQNKPNVIKCNRTYTTGSYIVRETAYDTIIDGLEAFTREVDIFYALELQPKLRCFCVRPHVTCQQPGFSDIQQRRVKYQTKDRPPV